MDIVGGGKDSKSGEAFGLGARKAAVSGSPKLKVSSGADIVGMIGSGLSDVKVGTSGKYPPPNEPLRSLGDCSRGETLSS